MSKGIAFWKIVGVLFGAVVIGAGTLVGIGALIAQDPPEPIRSIGHFIYVKSLSEEDKVRLITDDLRKIDSVESIDVNSTDDSDLRIKISVRESQDDSTDGSIRGVCNEGRYLWQNFSPHDVTCTIVPAQ
jgi:hypothetical protein